MSHWNLDMRVPKFLLPAPKKLDFGPKNGIFVHFGPGLAGSFGALLVDWLVVLARGLYLARHLFTLFYLSNTRRHVSTATSVYRFGEIESGLGFC